MLIRIRNNFFTASCHCHMLYHVVIDDVKSDTAFTVYEKNNVIVKCKN